MRAPCTVFVLPILFSAAAAMAQSTAHFSSYFGGSARDATVIVRRSAGGEITIVGHTGSQGLGTPGAMQQSLAMAPTTPPNGDIDAFVARFAPLQPGPGYVLQWCTYLGGTGFELPFDAEVDPNGITTVVGLSTSIDFPDPTGTNPPVRNGNSDGFLAQIDPTGSVCLASMFFGGPFDDRINEVELDPAAGVVTIAGVTEDILNSTNLPAATNAYHGGLSDAFVARLVVSAGSQVPLWSTYVGGSSHEAMTFAGWTGWSVWEGNLDRMAMTSGPNGEPALVTSSFSSNAMTTANAYQPSHAGVEDNYFVVVDPSTGALSYATFLGGSTYERTKTIAPHPAGGFVLGGLTWSTNFPTTANSLQPAVSQAGDPDAFVSWLDPDLPAAQQLHYSTYFGASGGQDCVLGLAVDSGGVVTFGGYTVGGVPLTPRCWQGPATSTYYGCLARLELAGQGGLDLHYSTRVGQAGTGMLVTDVLLDELGDAWFTGRTLSATYPVIHSTSSYAGSFDVILTHLELLPGGVQRQQLAFGTPTCGMPPVPLHTGVAWPAVPATAFGITATDAPPSSPGLLVLGLPRATPQNLPLPYNGWLLVDSLVNAIVFSDPQGYARFDLHLPAGPSGPLTWGFGAEWFFLTNPVCPGSGPLGNSERLLF